MLGICLGPIVPRSSLSFCDASTSSVYCHMLLVCWVHLMMLSVSWGMLKSQSRRKENKQVEFLCISTLTYKQWWVMKIKRSQNIEIASSKEFWISNLRLNKSDSLAFWKIIQHQLGPISWLCLPKVKNQRLRTQGILCLGQPYFTD